MECRSSQIHSDIRANREEVLRKLAIDSINVQDACNGSGVAHSLVGAFQKLRSIGITDTDKLNKHPIIRMYIHKLHNLCMRDCYCSVNLDNFHTDYIEVKQLAGEGENDKS